MTEHHAVCPTCGQGAVREITSRRGGTMDANFDCANGHIWRTRWPVPDEGAA